MAGRALLDTSAVVALLRGDRALVNKLGPFDETYTSAVVLGELLYGARHSGKPEQNLERVAAFAGSIVALPCDGRTAEVYARIKQQLRAKGQPIPDNDLWIASTAIQYALTLLHRDAHFDAVEELEAETW